MTNISALLTKSVQTLQLPKRRDLTAGQSLFTLIVVTMVLRLTWVALMPPNKDEGYHYLYAVHPNWSYFDHPPMMMVFVRAGLELCQGAVNPLSLRLGFVLLFAGSTWVLASWTRRYFGDWAGVYAAILWNLAPFYCFGAGGQAMPDGPFLFFALLTMAALSRALIEERGRTVPWIWVGLAWAGAILSKYHAIFLPAGALLYVILTPSARRLLLTPGPYLAVLIGIVGFTPVLYWNATHHWASFAFQGGRAVGAQFRPSEIGMMMIGQMGFLTPWLWGAALMILVARLRAWQRLRPIEQLLICLAIVPLTFFLSVSCMRKVYPHWTLLGFVPLLPMLGQRCVAWAGRWPRTARWAGFAWAIVLMSVGFVYAEHVRSGLLPLKRDPAHEQSGWPSLAQELQARGLVGQPGTFLFCETWHESGQLSFALANQTPVLCYNSADARGFAFWHHPEDCVGKDGLLISFDDCPWHPSHYRDYFTRFELEAEFSMSRGGTPFRPVRVYRCIDQQRPFPVNFTK